MTLWAGVSALAAFGCNGRTLDGPSVCEAAADGGQDPLTDPGACETYLVEPPGADERVPIRVENRSDETIYIPQYLLCRTGHVQLTGVTGSREVVSPRDCSEVGQQLCTQFAGGSDPCGLVCVDSPVVRIEAGGVAEVSIPDALYVQTMLPDQCGSQESCLAPVPIGTGSYELTALLYPCEDDPDAECDCTPNADGWCELPVSTEFFPRDDLERVTAEWNGVCDPVLIVD